MRANLFDLAEQRYGDVDAVVNTAGIMLLSPLTELELRRLRPDAPHQRPGAFVVSQQAARRVRGGGAIINLVIVDHETRVVELHRLHAATKGAVDAMTLILARELRGRDITVNAVAAEADRHPAVHERQAAVRHRHPLPDRAARTPRSPRRRRRDRLVSPLPAPGRWINGQVIYSNGARHLTCRVSEEHRGERQRARSGPSA